PIVRAPELLAVLTIKNRLVGWTGSAADAALPCGFIRGPAPPASARDSDVLSATTGARSSLNTPSSLPPMATTLTFANHFGPGALLTTGWQN
ncbi:hypothetical protein H4R34_006146, partial [Dimargaris verticillata]